MKNQKFQWIKKILFNPFGYTLGSLIIIGFIFFPLHSKIGEGAFIICNIFPVICGLFFGMRWGIVYSIIHFFLVVSLATFTGAGFNEFVCFVLINVFLKVFAVGRVPSIMFETL